MDKKINYKLGFDSWGQEESDAIDRVILSRQFSMGKEVKSFEQMFAERFQRRFAVMVNSGSSANLLMIAALIYGPCKILERGDEVIVPVVSWSTTYAPLIQFGLNIKFVDIDPRTLNISTSQLEAAITKRTKALFVVNLLGNPNQFDQISSLVEKHDLVLIEDNCESMGARYKGSETGTFGVMASFSCYYSHHISTIEGGIIVTDDIDLRDTLVSLRAHGWTRDLPPESRLRSGELRSNFLEKFNFVVPGFNVRPTEFAGAIGIQQLSKHDDYLKIRRENAYHFCDTFRQFIPKIQVQHEVGESSWFGFSMLLDPAISRDTLVEYLEERGIETRPIVAGNFFENKNILRFADYSVQETLCGADLVEKHGLFVGNAGCNLRAEIDYLADSLKFFLDAQT